MTYRVARPGHMGMIKPDRFLLTPLPSSILERIGHLDRVCRIISAREIIYRATLSFYFGVTA